MAVQDEGAESESESEPEDGSTAPLFRYSPIESPTHIRVLDIHPAAGLDHPIACTLRHINLDHQPAYEALSYTWGGIDNQTGIWLNGQPFTVMENAAAALRRLRSPKQVRIIWMDAICINQRDKAEKGYQLPLMTRIYQQAQQACVWLGELTDGGLHGEIRELMNRPWWERVWIMQEAIVSKSIVIMCGGETATWDRIETAIKNSSFRAPPLEDNFGLGENKHARLFNDKYLAVNEFRQKWAQGVFHVSVYKMLYDFRGLRCSNARDRIYGFLGLTSLSSHPDFQARYKARVWREYTHLDPAPLLDWSETEPLYCAGGTMGRASVYPDTNHPALVVDGIEFDVISHLSEAWHPESDVLELSRRQVSELESWESLATAELGPACPYGGGKARRDALWRTHIADFTGDKAAPPSLGWAVECWYDHDGWAKPLADPIDLTSNIYHMGSFWSKAMQQGAVMQKMQDYVINFCKEWTMGPEKTDEELEAMGIRESFKRIGSEASGEWKVQRGACKEYGECVRRIYQACAHRRLLITARGYLGLAPWNAQVGDAVFILKGGKTPFLLRGHEGPDQGYRLVGEAFVYGIMAGEAVDLVPELKRVRLL
ncbi:heterokaryon incompatibility protein-domain-containing protein [Dactylonectria macrodidyma]|uniref:Heterokaryon incompatibility protein-domain-containing protein n=1 Tax=Dactylonectria macrodidyma TaxID=307937 RepID=A0A9P9JC60_9HYPO|nr:heterokaryon incompatibility protein-domain-containing protein [Dactylonectria macrodidyma]